MKILLSIFLSIAFLNTVFTQPKLMEDQLEHDMEEELPTLLIFSGSDWCKPCMKLKKEVIDTPTFQNFAQQEVAIKIVDFPYKKANKLSKEKQKENEGLSERYNTSGLLPNVVLIDEKGQVLKTIKSRTTQRFIREIQNAKTAQTK